MHMSNRLHVLMASLLSPEYVPFLLSSFLHLLNVVLAASPLAALQQEQLPILASLNAHRLTDKHTQMHTDRHIHHYIYTDFEMELLTILPSLVKIKLVRYNCLKTVALPICFVIAFWGFLK